MISSKGLPLWLRSALAWILHQIPERLLSLLLPARLGFEAGAEPPAMTPPVTAVRVFMGPVNSAGQAWQWLRALEREHPELAGRVMSIRSDQGFDFPSDYSVPLGTYRWSKRWQRAQREAVLGGFTHVIMESGKRLFGDVFPGSAESEVNELLRRGVRVALLFHGSDIRLPSRHAANSPWSPFNAGLADQAEVFEKRASANARLAESAGTSVFVSTAGLLRDLPTARWLPVVVDTAAWRSDREPLSAGRPPVVVHAPSNSAVKGSDLVDPILQRLNEEGLIEYRRVSGVPWAQMPHIFGAADVVIDQFRTGDYGVASCEAMAAGRIVICHVDDQVRGHVTKATGRELPIVDSTPDDLEERLRQMIEAPEGYVDRARAGVEFARAVHGGAHSAGQLAEFIRGESR